MRLLLAGFLLSAALTAHAQEGYPLDGTWRGQRQGNVVVMVIEWDGSKVGGVVNPGPKSLKINDVQLDPEGWKVSIQAESKTGQKMTFEGVLEDLGSYHRHITGKWTEGGKSYDVKVQRE